MLAEEIALAVAGQTLQQGLNKLSGHKRDIVLNAILGVFGIALCVMSINKLYKAITEEHAE